MLRLYLFHAFTTLPSVMWIPILASDWGRLFQHWDQLALPPDDLETAGWSTLPSTPAELSTEGWEAFKRSIGILGTCLREAPEFSARKRRKQAADGARG